MKFRGSSFAKQWQQKAGSTAQAGDKHQPPNFICISILLTSDSLMALEGLEVTSAGALAWGLLDNLPPLKKKSH